MSARRLSDLDRARRAFLLVLCNRAHVEPTIHRHYLEEKVVTVFRAEQGQELRARLDLPGQRLFDAFMAEEGT